MAQAATHVHWLKELHSFSFLLFKSDGCSLAFLVLKLYFAFFLLLLLLLLSLPCTLKRSSE